MNTLRKYFKVLMLMFIIMATVVSLVGINSATAKSANTSVKAVRKRIITPNHARNFLNDLDMPTRDYEKTVDSSRYGKYEARSDYLKLETRDFDRYINNLTYYVRGDKFVAKAVELDLNVNDLTYKANAVGEFIKYSNSLMHKVTGKSLTPEMKKAMLTKSSGQWTVQGYNIKFKKEIFPDEKPIKGVESTSDHGAFSLTFLIEL